MIEYRPWVKAWAFGVLIVSPALAVYLIGIWL